MEKNNIVTLNQYIKNGKAKSFLNLMKKVDKALKEEHEKGLVIVNINLDQILIDQTTGNIIFPTLNKFDPLERTIAGYKTGVSINADRKSSFEHNENSLALMILGWYVNPDHSSIESDMVAVENYDEYKKVIPNWISEYFENRFRRMIDINFFEYYDKKFVARINEDINLLQLSSQDREKMNQGIVRSINFSIKELLSSSRINNQDLFGFYEQYVIDNYQKNFSIHGEEEKITAGGPGQSLVKTLYKPGTQMEYLDDEIDYHIENINKNNGQVAFASTIILILTGCLTLLISTVCFIIFSKLF